MSIILNYTNFGTNPENQKFLTPFIDNIVVKTSFILMPPNSTTVRHRT